MASYDPGFTVTNTAAMEILNAAIARTVEFFANIPKEEKTVKWMNKLVETQIVQASKYLEPRMTSPGFPNRFGQIICRESHRLLKDLSESEGLAESEMVCPQNGFVYVPDWDMAVICHALFGKEECSPETLYSALLNVSNAGKVLRRNRSEDDIKNYQVDAIDEKFPESYGRGFSLAESHYNAARQVTALQLAKEVLVGLIQHQQWSIPAGLRAALENRTDLYVVVQ